MTDDAGTPATSDSVADDAGTRATSDDVARLRDDLDAAREQIEGLEREAANEHARAAQAALDAEALRDELKAASDGASLLRTQIEASEANARDAVVRYRELALRSAPELPPEMIAGDTFDAVDASLETARTLASRVREQIVAQSNAARVPAGAPERRGPDTSALTPEQKIRFGLNQRRFDG